MVFRSGLVLPRTHETFVSDGTRALSPLLWLCVRSYSLNLVTKKSQTTSSLLVRRCCNCFYFFSSTNCSGWAHVPLYMAFRLRFHLVYVFMMMTLLLPLPLQKGIFYSLFKRWAHTDRVSDNGARRGGPSRVFIIFISFRLCVSLSTQGSGSSIVCLGCTLRLNGQTTVVFLSFFKYFAPKI